jgi:hypothetical protein
VASNRGSSQQVPRQRGAAPDAIGQHSHLNIATDGFRRPLYEGGHFPRFYDVAFPRGGRDEHSVRRADANYGGPVPEPGGVSNEHRIAIGQHRHQAGQTFGVCLGIGW